MIVRLLMIACFVVFNQYAGMAQLWQKPIPPAKAEQWVVETFAKGKVPPFSFMLNSKPSIDFIRKWKHGLVKNASANPDEIHYTASYLDAAQKLRVECKITVFTKFNSVDWVLYFTNEGSVNSGQIKSVNAVDLGIQFPLANITNLYASEGSDHNVNDFRMQKYVLNNGDHRLMEPQSGRSSDKTAFPFFNIESEGKGGVIVAIGWTGTWFADVARVADKEMELRAGMKGTDLYLLPKESIRSPRISLTFWESNNFIDGHNQFRQFMLAHNSRKINGKFAEYPLSGGFEWGDPQPCNEYTCLTEDLAIAFAKRYKQFGIMPDVMWLDAGWYAGSGGPDFKDVNWYNSVGTWRVDTTRFPKGFKPLSNVVHQLGSKLMVWFEPERVMKGSEFATRFPQWMMKRPGEESMFIYNLGNKEAREWLSKYMGDFLEENGIDYYRQDFNTPIQPFWDANDEPNRKGITQIRYVEGLYAYWDYLLERFPNLLIDNCASGGRRLDLETSRRSAPLWRTDYQYGEPNGAQNHTYWLNFYLPLHGTGVFAFDEYSFHSVLSSAMVLNWDLTSREGDVREMRRLVDQYKSIRPYFYENYYPLSGFKDFKPLNVWLAYQLDRPSDQTGLVVAFKRKDSKSDKEVVRLNKLDPQATYELENLKDHSKITKTGSELLGGFEIELKASPGSVVYRYKKM